MTRMGDSGSARSVGSPARRPSGSSVTCWRGGIMASPRWVSSGRGPPGAPGCAGSGSACRRAGRARSGRDYVFTTPSGRCIDPNRLREQVWNRTLARAGLRRRTIYQTRHSFASNALAAGEPPSWVAAMLGHTTPEMLFSVYSRYIPNRTRRDGCALLARMVSSPHTEPLRTPDLLPSGDVGCRKRGNSRRCVAGSAKGGT